MITNTVGLPILYNHVYIGPSITSDVTVISTYTSSADSAELNEVLVQWEHEVRNGNIHNYDHCTYDVVVMLTFIKGP